MDALGETPYDPEEPLVAKGRTLRIMQTPCNHRYHELCLTEWMKTKLVCPFDRTELPGVGDSYQSIN